MNGNDLCKHILNYTKNDKTNTAIMLNGDWGIGKSYFVKNELIPYLENKGKTKCVIISLYGIYGVDDFSKSVYWGLRSLNSSSNHEGVMGGIILAKTVVKSITSAVGVDLSIKDEDLKKLYKSIDLTDKLLVVEDLERTDVDLLTILGYINNLVEHDGAKILLVANEKKLIERKKIQDEPDAEVNAKSEKETYHYEYTDKTIRYLELKEKTVSETINYYGNHKIAISQIIKMFKNDVLSRFDTEECINDIYEIMILNRNYNLRSFIYGCQKTVELFSYVDETLSEDFVKTLFYSLVAYSLKMNRSIRDKWDGDKLYSCDLGMLKYPLFKFCYDYIWFQEINVEQIREAAGVLEKIRLYDKNKTQNDKDVTIVCNYFREYEADVIKAVNSITERLRDETDISFYDYGTIVAHMIIIEHLLKVDISEAKRLMLNNLSKCGKEIDRDYLFRITLRNEKEPLREEFEQFEKDAYEAIEKDNTIDGFDYLPDQSKLFYKYVCDNEALFHSKRQFISLFDVEKLVYMFCNSSPSQKDDIRSTFLSIYSNVNAKVFFNDDKPALERLRAGIIEYINSGVDDRIQLQQSNWFVSNLSEFIDSL